MKRLALATLACAAAALAPAAAQAHLIISGIGPVYDGGAHFALSPEDSLPVLALAAFAGLRGPAAARFSLAWLGLAWFTAGLVSSAYGAPLPTIWLGVAAAGLLLAFGGLLAANIDLSPEVCAAAAALVGVVRGAADLSGVPLSAGSALNAFGMAATATVLFALAASLTLPLRRTWTIIAARVAGSWIAAVGLLLAGWMARYGAQVG